MLHTKFLGSTEINAMFCFGAIKVFYAVFGNLRKVRVGKVSVVNGY